MWLRNKRSEAIMEIARRSVEETAEPPLKRVACEGGTVGLVVGDPR